MNPSQSSVIFPDPLRSIDVSTVSSVTPTPIGLPLDAGARIIKFTNDSNVLVLLLWNGMQPNEVFPANSFALLDMSTNKEVSGIWEIQKGTQFYLLATAGGVGHFYISVYRGLTQ